MTFVNKTIKSNYLQEDYEVSCWEMNQKNGRTLTIVEHAAFEDIIFNNLHVEGFSYDLEPVTGVANHPVMKCTMRDENGRKIVAIGEAHPNSLINEISRQNPVIMASNRAFDRAAIRYLNLEGKVYSSEEIPNDDADKEDTANDMSELFNDNIETEALFTEEVVAESVKESETYDPGSVVINFGKYRNKNMTVAKICEIDESWVDYTTTNMNTDTAGEVTKKQVQALKDYKAQIASQTA